MRLIQGYFLYTAKYSKHFLSATAVGAASTVLMVANVRDCTSLMSNWTLLTSKLAASDIWKSRNS